MVPKLHAKGSSFKGIAAYVLHDKDRAKTATRVAWAETRNLATDNPHVAWKVMAATAMDQERLKEQAGIKKTGRKSFDAVLHFTLSWHPEEKENLNREEMIRAANQAIRALKASDRQAMIVCHSEEPQPHVHVILNRISSDDGRMLSSSKEKLELSKWAQAYEKERGFVYCEERVLNNEARARDEYTRGQKDKARNIFEAEAANDNIPDAKILREQQRRKEFELFEKGREVQKRHGKAWAELQRAHKERVKQVKTEAARFAAVQKDAIREKRRPGWTMLFHEQQAAMRDFERREQTLLGRFKNVLGAIDLKAIIKGRTDVQEEGRSRGQAITEAFKALSDAGVRLEVLKRQQAAEKRGFERSQKQEETESDRSVRASREELLQKSRASFERERNDVILIQGMDGAKLRAERKTRNEQRAKAWESYRDGRRARAPELKAQNPAFVKNEPPQETQRPQAVGQPEIKPEIGVEQERPSHAPEVISPDEAREREIRELKERREQRARDRDRGRR